MYNLTRIILLCLGMQFQSFGSPDDRIPFYEDYLKNGDLDGFLKVAEEFLVKNPDRVEAPRLAFDFLLVAKAAQDLEAIDLATSSLLFQFSNSLPTLHLLSSFEKGSPALVKLLKNKVDKSDLKTNKFAVNFCRAIVLIARIQGPDLLRDPGLRLRAYLMAKKAGVESIIESTQSALAKGSTGNNSTDKIFSIVLSDASAMEKIPQLSDLSGNEVNFCLSYYLSELSEKERESENIKAIRIKNALFGGERNSRFAKELINSLPAKSRSSPKYQVLLAHAKYMDGQKDECILGLKKISKNSDWGKTARLYADGLEFSENRKKMLLEALGKAIDKLEKEGDTFFIAAKWKKKSGSEKTKNFNLYLGISNFLKQFEIQLHADKKLKFSYRTNKDESALFLDSANKILAFETPGAIPTPKVSILRDAESGSFKYNFNLNFSPSFESLLTEAKSILQNAYIGTPTGREVLLTHLLSQKAIWLGVPKPTPEGTSFPVLSLQADRSEPLKSSLVFDLTGNLSSFQIDGFEVTRLKKGDQNLLSELPKWPKLEIETEEKFDFKLLMSVLSEATTFGNK